MFVLDLAAGVSVKEFIGIRGLMRLYPAAISLDYNLSDLRRQPIVGHLIVMIRKALVGAIRTFARGLRRQYKINENLIDGKPVFTLLS